MVVESPISMNLTHQNLNKMKKIIINICFLLAVAPCMAQSGYVEFDSITYSGVKIIDQGKRLNALSCQWQKSKNNLVQLTPYEVKSYNFGNEKYVARDIEINGKEGRFFLEEMVSGKLTLYFIKYEGKHFFIEKDRAFFIGIPKNKENEKSAYKAQLKGITEDCPEVADAANFVGYNKRSLMRFIERYEKCVSRPFPHFRYGIKAGFEWSKFIDPPQSLERFNIKYSGAFSLGLFMDTPILVSDFSFNLGINYSRHGYSYNNLTRDADYDFVANLSSLKMPVLVRYSLPTNKYRFFVQSGGIVEYHFNKDAHLYKSTINGNIITIDRTMALKIDDVRFGFSIGVGFEKKVTSRNSLFLEFSVNQLYGDMKNRNILLTIGLNI